MLKKKWFIMLLLLLVALAISTPLVVSAGSSATDQSLAQEQYQLSKADADTRLEVSGCKVDKGKVRIRFDMYLKPDAPGYEQHHIEVPVIPEGGYPGKVDKKTGEPRDWDDYNKWFESLPTVWQTNPFVCVFAYFDANATDEEIRRKQVEILDEAYKSWVDQNASTESISIALSKVLDRVIEGDTSPGNLRACEARLAVITSRAIEFDSRVVK